MSAERNPSKASSARRLRVSDTLTDEISVLLLGYDTELTYRKLEDSCILLGRGVDYIATHPDLVCRRGTAPRRTAEA